MRLLAREKYFWPGLNNEVDNLVKSCAKCQENQNSQAKEPLMISTSHHPMDMLGIDLFSYEQHEYLALGDHFSGYLWCSKLNRTRSEDLIKVLKRIFNEYGFPNCLRHDGAKNLDSQEMDDFLAEHFIINELSSAHFPQSNGFSESCVKSLKSLLKKCDGNWEKFCQALLEHRATPRSDGTVPARLFFGRNIKTSLPSLPNTFHPSQEVLQEHDSKLRQREAGKKSFDKHAISLPELAVGDKVRIQNPFTHAWDNLGLIKEIRSSGCSYQVEDNSGKLLLRNRRFLRPDFSNDEDKNADKTQSSPAPTSILQRSSRLAKKKVCFS